MGQKRAAASLCHPPIPLADPAFPPAIAFDSDATLCSCISVRESLASTGKVWPADRIESRSDRLDRTTERIARYVSRLGLESRDTCSNDSAFGSILRMKAGQIDLCGNPLHLLANLPA